MSTKLPTLVRGTTYPINGTYKDAAGNTDITGATVFFTIKSLEFDADTVDSDAIVKKTVTSFASPLLGQYYIEVVPTDTSAVTPGNYFYDIKIKLASGKIYLLAEGGIKIEGTPTNRES